MRKNRFLILIALVLVCAMLAVTVVGCQKEQNNAGNDTTLVPDDGNGKDNGDNEGNTNAGAGGFGDGEGSSTDNGSTLNLSDLDSFVKFTVKANSASDIAVTDSKGDPVAVSVKSNGDGTYGIWAPDGGYSANVIYKITLSNGATFVGQDERVVAIRFSIGSSSSSVKFTNNYLTYSESAIEDVEYMENSEKTDAYGVTTGQMVLQINSSNALDAGTIFIVEKENGMQSAYKVVSATTGGMQNGKCLINYVKPDLEEVFETFDYSGTSKMTAQSDVNFNYMEGKEVLENSELAMGIFEMFGSAPQFDISVPEFDKDGHVVVDITITIPNVATINAGDATSKTDLVITVHNVMDVEASANISKETITENFWLKATVNNDITTTVTLGTDAGYSADVNVPELMNKLIELANEDKDDATAIPLFQWTVPIANGAASITYNADLLFRFSVAGDINASAHANLDYEVGVTYTKADGLNAYSNELDGNGFDNVDVSIGGQAELKIGLRQDLSFDILAGVLGIGIEAEIGNYNRLYGYGKSSNLIDKDTESYFVGDIYFEGGFYYDINLSYGLKIGSLLNLSDKADIVDGEIKGYEAGNRYLVLSVGAEESNYTLKAYTSEIPDIYYKNVYDLVTRATNKEVAAAEEFTFETENANLKVNENYEIVVTKDIESTPVVARYAANDKLYATVNYKFSLENPILDKDTITINKSTFNNSSKPVTFVINYNGFASTATTVESDEFTLSIVERADNKATVAVPYEELLVLGNGMNALEMTVGGKPLTLNLDVTGKVAWNQFATGANSYNVFTPDQIIDLSTAAVSDGFNGVVITISEDIDMNGATLAPISNFKGTLQGNGKTISNYTVNAFSGENAGFIGVNEGKIDNIVFAGDVNVALEATTGKDYAVAGIAAVNGANGTITNCKFTGDVNVYSYGLAAFVDFDVAAITAVNSGTLSANGGAGELTSVKVTVKFDLANVNVNIGDTTSVSNDIDTIVESIVCENGASGGPYATKCNIK